MPTSWQTSHWIASWSCGMPARISAISACSWRRWAGSTAAREPSSMSTVIGAIGDGRQTWKRVAAAIAPSASSAAKTRVGGERGVGEADPREHELVGVDHEPRLRPGRVAAGRRGHELEPGGALVGRCGPAVPAAALAGLAVGDPPDVLAERARDGAKDALGVGERDAADEMHAPRVAGATAFRSSAVAFSVGLLAPAPPPGSSRSAEGAQPSPTPLTPA